MIWFDAKNYPCFDDLLLPDNYVFVSVNQEAKLIEYYDYSKRICDLQLFHTFFKLTEAEGNLEEKLINSKISKAIGLYVNEIEQSRDIEHIEFRLELFHFLKANFEEHSQSTTTSLIESIYTPYLEIDPSLLDVGIANTVDSFNNFSFSNENNQQTIEIDVHVMETNQPGTVYHLNIPMIWTPSDINSQIIKIKMGEMNKSNEEIDEIVNRYKDAYMLNVCGCDEIFHGSKCHISQYKVIFIILSSK